MSGSVAESSPSICENLGSIPITVEKNNQENKIKCTVSLLIAFPHPYYACASFHDKRIQPDLYLRFGSGMFPRAMGLESWLLSNGIIAQW